MTFADRVQLVGYPSMTPRAQLQLRMEERSGGGKGKGKVGKTKAQVRRVVRNDVGDVDVSGTHQEEAQWPVGSAKNARGGRRQNELIPACRAGRQVEPHRGT